MWWQRLLCSERFVLFDMEINIGGVSDLSQYPVIVISIFCDIILWYDIRILSYIGDILATSSSLLVAQDTRHMSE